MQTRSADTGLKTVLRSRARLKGGNFVCDTGGFRIVCMGVLAFYDCRDKPAAFSDEIK